MRLVRVNFAGWNQLGDWLRQVDRVPECGPRPRGAARLAASQATASARIKRGVSHMLISAIHLDRPKLCAAQRLTDYMLHV